MTTTQPSPQHATPSSALQAPDQPQEPTTTAAAAPATPVANDTTVESGENSYTIRPNFRAKFRPQVVNKMIHALLQERLQGATYHPDTASQWTKEIADDLKLRLKELNLPRYKYVCNVVIGEMRGEGVRLGCRCFWDSDTDNIAQETFINESLFCSAAAFGVYYY
ncbi:MAG: hypothetical protein SGCHY_000747 [Lobulomycetales sp.]